MSDRYFALQIDGGEVESEEDEEVAEGEIHDFLVLHEDQDGVILEDEDDDDEEDSDYEEDEDDDGNDDEAESVIPVDAAGPSTASQDAVINQVSEHAVEDSEDCVRRKGEGEASSSQGNGKGGGGENDRGGEWSRSEIDGLFCPICMEAWTNGDDHQVWCYSYSFFAFFSSLFKMCIYTQSYMILIFGSICHLTCWSFGVVMIIILKNLGANTCEINLHIILMCWGRLYGNHTCLEDKVI